MTDLQDNLLECEACPTKAKVLNTITTPNGKMQVCSNCAAQSFSGIKIQPKTTNQIPEVFPSSRTKEEHPAVKDYLQSISKVSNPEEVPIPSDPKKKLTQSELFAHYLTDETVKIESLFNGSLDLSVAYAKLEERIALYESIAFEAKVRASENLKKKREIDAATGKNRWDKERRGEDKTNLSDPRNNPLLSKAQKQHKQELSKLEKIIKGFIDTGMTDEEILDMCPASKFKGSEVREAITKFRS